MSILHYTIQKSYKIMFRNTRNGSRGQAVSWLYSDGSLDLISKTSYSPLWVCCGCATVNTPKYVQPEPIDLHVQQIHNLNDSRVNPVVASAAVQHRRARSSGCRHKAVSYYSVWPLLNSNLLASLRMLCISVFHSGSAYRNEQRLIALDQ